MTGAIPGSISRWPAVMRVPSTPATPATPATSPCGEAGWALAVRWQGGLPGAGAGRPTVQARGEDGDGPERQHPRPRDLRTLRAHRGTLLPRDEVRARGRR